MLAYFIAATNEVEILFACFEAKRLERKACAPPNELFISYLVLVFV
jgi:hypothetical protein